MSDFAKLMCSVLPQSAVAALMGEDAVVIEPQEGSRALAEVLADKGLFEEKIRALEDKFAVERRVALLLWQKQFVRGFLGQWLANALLGEAVPLNLADFYVDGAKLKGVQMQQGAVLDVEQTAAVLSEFAERLQETFVAYGVHTTDSWGNLGLAVAEPWMKARKWAVDAVALAQSHADFVRYLPQALQSAMLLLPYEQEGRQALHIRRRRSCCHKYEVPNKDYCSTCSKVPLEEQLQAVMAAD